MKITAFTALRATLAGSLLVSGMNILPAAAAEAGFRDMPPEIFARECTDTNSFTQVCGEKQQE